MLHSRVTRARALSRAGRGLKIPSQNRCSLGVRQVATARHDRHAEVVWGRGGRLGGCATQMSILAVVRICTRPLPDENGHLVWDDLEFLGKHML